MNTFTREVLADLKSLRAIERETVAKVLKRLVDVVSWSIHLELGYKTLQEFCEKELKYTEDEAGLCIRAMWVVEDIPPIGKELEDGKLSLTVLSKAQSAFRREEKTNGKLPIAQKEEIISQLAGTSVRKAERELATLFPASQIPKESSKPLTEDLTERTFVSSR